MLYHIRWLFLSGLSQCVAMIYGRLIGLECILIFYQYFIGIFSSFLYTMFEIRCMWCSIMSSVYSYYNLRFSIRGQWLPSSRLLVLCRLFRHYILLLSTIVTRVSPPYSINFIAFFSIPGVLWYLKFGIADFTS